MDEFLRTHARIRCPEPGCRQTAIERTLAFANQLTGEPIVLQNRMTELSGGQTRALLIADATVICDTPIVLLDEVENAGIHRTRAIELLREHRKIFIFVTTIPRIALLSDYRIVMKGGIVTQVARRTRRSEDRRPVVSRPTTHSPICATSFGRGRESLRWNWNEVNMKLVICAGPATTGKTAVLRHIIAKLKAGGSRPAFLKIDVQYAEEDEHLAREFGIPTRKVYSGELCPDHCNVMVLGDALQWARKAESMCCWWKRRDCACAVLHMLTAVWA